MIRNIRNNHTEMSDSDNTPSEEETSESIKGTPCETCRICLNEGKLPIFGAGTSEKLSKAIMEIAGIEVGADDPHPKCLCQSCHALLDGAILFKTNAQKSDRILKESLKLLESSELSVTFLLLDGDDVNEDVEIIDTELLETGELVKGDDVNDDMVITDTELSETSELVDGIDVNDDKKIIGTEPSETDELSESDDVNYKMEVIDDAYDEVKRGPHRVEKNGKANDDTEITKDNKNPDNSIILGAEEQLKFKLSWKCLMCDMQFKTSKQFNDHKSSMDVKTMQITCNICNETFIHQHYKKHIALHKEKGADIIDHEIPYLQKAGQVTCAICNKTYSRKYYKTHIRYHLAITPHMCDICGKKFVAKSQFNRHRVIHFNDLPFQCTVCPYRGRFKQALLIHMRTHTGEKPYHCDQCPAQFMSRGNLSNHIQTHTGKHKYHCDMCKCGFYNKWDIDRHIRNEHFNAKDHVCNICDKVFKNRKLLMNHELGVHKREKITPGKRAIYLNLEKMKNDKTKS